MAETPEKPINLGGVAQGLPQYVPPARYSGGGGGGGERTSLSFEEMAERIPTKVEGVASIPASAIYVGDRYKSSFPFRNTEEMAAQQQSTLDKWGNGFAKFVGTTATSFLNGTVGTVVGVGNYIGSGFKASAFYDNPVNRFLDDANKKMEDLAPNYYTQAESDANWFSGENLLTANFWSDKVFKNLGYSVGSLAGGIAWGGILKAIGITNRLVNAGRGLETAAAVEKGIATASATGRFGAVSNALNSLSTQYLKPAAGRALLSSERAIISTMGSIGESSFEALQNMNEYRNKMIDTFVEENGYRPTGEDLAEINRYAENVGNFTWGMNALLLTATNFIQLPKILNSSKTAERRMMNNITKTKLDDAASVAEKVGADFKAVPSIYERVAGRPGKLFGKYVARPVGLLFAPVEAFEEGAQFAISTGVNDYFERAYENKEDTSGFFKNLAEVYKNVISEGVYQTLSTKEGLESMLIGGVAGGLQTSFSPFGLSEVKRTGFFGEGGIQGRNTQLAIDEMKKSKKLNEVLRDGVKYINIGINSQMRRRDAISENDTLSEKDYEKDYTLSYIMPRVKYGKLDSIKEELDLYRNTAASEEGFNELVADGTVLPGETKPQFLARLDSIKNTAKEVDKIYYMLSDRYSPVLGKDGKRAYDDSVIEKMTYASAKVVDYDERLASLEADLFRRGLNTQSFKDTLVQTEEWKKGNIEGAMKNPEVEKALKDIGAIIEGNEVEEYKKRLKEDFSDFAEMMLRRKTFIDEFNEMLEAPEKYKEVVPEQLATGVAKEEKKKIKIVTQKGEQEFEIGEEYFLGNKVEQSEEGYPIFRYPKFKILEELPDGKVRTQGEDGRIYDLNKSAFRNYKYGKVSTTLADRKGKFFLESVGKIFEMKRRLGKDPLRGWLEWSDKPGILMFSYKNEKGETISFEVKREQFKAKKGYKKPLIEMVGEMTSTQKEAFEGFQSEETTDPITLDRKIISDVVSGIYKSSKDRLDEINKTLDQKREALKKIQEDFDKITLTKKGEPKKTITKEARKTLNNLTSLRSSVEKEIEDLNRERDMLDATIPYFQDILDNMEEIGDETLLIEDLKEGIKNLEEMSSHTEDAISSGNSLLSSIDDALKTALSMIGDFAKKLRESNPNVPAALENLRDQAEAFVAEGGLRQYLQNKLDFGKDLVDVEDQLAEYAEQLKVPDMTSKVQSLQKDLQELQKGLDQFRTEQSVKERLLKGLEDAVNKLEEERKEEAIMQRSEKVIKEILGTADKGIQTRGYNKDYEGSAKKTDKAVVTSSKPTISDRPHHKRVNLFGSRRYLFPNSNRIKSVLVTSKNEETFGLKGLTQYLIDEGDATAEEKAKMDPTKTIVLVQVEEGKDGVVRLIGVDGKPIEEGNPLEQAIFQVFPDPALTWSADFVEEKKDNSMFRKDTPKETREHYKKEYKQWWDSVIDSPPMGLFSSDFSFGIPEYVMKLDDKGNSVRDFDAIVPVIDAKLIDPSDLAVNSVIFVPTTDENAVERGSTRFESPLGRPFLALPNAYVKLKNAKFTRKKAEVIYEAILQLSKEIRKDGDAQSDKSKRLVNWLKSVVYWGLPRNKTGYNNIFFERTDEGFFLSVSGKGKKYFFTPSALEDNRQELIDTISNMFHNVRYDLVSADNKDKKWKEPYEEIIGFDKEGNPIVREVKGNPYWPNYQTYLLSQEGRPLEEVPLFTQMKPVKTDDDVNRKGIYATVSSLSKYYTTPPVAKKAAITPAGAPPSTPKTETTQVDITGEKPNTVKIGKYGEVEFTFNITEYIESGETGKKGLFITDKGAVENIMKDKGVDADKALEIIGASIVAKYLQPLIDEYKKGKEAAQTPTFDFSGEGENIMTLQVGDVPFKINAQEYIESNGDRGLEVAFPKEVIDKVIKIKKEKGKTISEDGAKGIIKAAVANKLVPYLDALRPPAPVVDVITDEVYNNFIDKNTVPNDILNSIADKVINRTTLSERETAIFSGKTSEINELIRKKAPVKEVPTLAETKINIYAGKGENADLSNFANRPFIVPEVEGISYDVSSGTIGTIGNSKTGFKKIKYKTVEGAYQAAKIQYTTESESEFIELNGHGYDYFIEKLANATGAEAKKIGRSIKGINVKKWDEDSSTIMKQLIRSSFEQNPTALERLLATGNATLTHTQDKGKWGTEFPKLLMEVREELRGVAPSTELPVSDIEKRKELDIINNAKLAALELEDENYKTDSFGRLKFTDQEAEELFVYLRDVVKVPSLAKTEEERRLNKLKQLLYEAKSANVQEYDKFDSDLEKYFKNPKALALYRQYLANLKNAPKLLEERFKNDRVFSQEIKKESGLTGIVYELIGKIGFIDHLDNSTSLIQFATDELGIDRGSKEAYDNLYKYIKFRDSQTTRFLLEAVKTEFSDIKPRIVSSTASFVTQPTPIITDAPKTEITNEEEKLMREQMDDIEDDPLYRKQLVSEVKKFETENWKKLEQWFKTNFPNVPVYRVKNIIQTTNGGTAWGMFKDAAIYIYENAEVGTAYHEVFEAVWSMFATPAEKLAVTREFKSRKGTFVDRPTGETVKYSEATDEQVREQLAEEFRDYVQYKKIPPKPVSGKPWIVKLFSDLVSFIKTFFTGNKATTNTLSLFERIGGGYYKQYSPYHASLAFAKKGIIDIEQAYADSSSAFRIKDIPANEVHDIMQHMTFVTVSKLFRTKRGLFVLENNTISKEELYKDLLKDIQKTVLKKRKEAEIALDKEEMTQEEADAIIAESQALWKKVTSQWEDLKKKHEEYLSTYSITFDENDDVQISSDERTKETGWQEATKIDGYRKANTAVKLALSTLPVMQSNGKPVISSIGGYKLVPTSRAFMAVMNNVHTSRTVDEMLDRIHDMALEDVNYELLYQRLTGEFSVNNTSDITQLEEVHDGQLIAAFWKTFKKQNPDVKNVFIFENGDVEVGDSNLATAARQVRSEYINNLIKIVRGKNKYFEYKNKAFVGKKDSVAEYKLDNDDTRIAFLKSLGIEFLPSEIATLPIDKKDTFIKAAAGIKRSIEKADKIMSPSGKALEIRGQLMALSLLRSYINNPEFDSTFFNVKGERTQTFIGPNASSNLYDVLSQIDTLDDLVGTEYEYLVSDVFSKEYIDEKGNKIATSVILKNMFDYESGRKIADAESFFKTGWADGTINNATGKKKQTSKLNYKERLVQELNLNLAGWYYNLVPGDASLQWMNYMGNHIKPEKLLSGYSTVNEIFKGYFIAEYLLSKDDRRIKKQANRQSKDLRFLKPIFDAYDEKLHSDIVNETSENPLLVYDKYKEKINAAVQSYIQKQMLSLKNELTEYGVISQLSSGNYSVEDIKLPDADNISEGDLNRELSALTINYIINNIEYHKLLYSDPYQYADELKRIKSFLSPRQAIASSDKFNRLLNKVWNKGYSKNDIGHRDFEKNYYRTSTLGDISATSSLKDYGVYDETDGGGIIIMSAHRDLRIRSGEWNDEEERQYRYDVIWEKVHKIERLKESGLSEEEIREQRKDLRMSKEEMDLYQQGNPGVMSAYTPLKPIVSGRKLNDKEYNDIVLDKFALYPLSYRIVMQVAEAGGNKDLAASNLYNKMQSEGVDYVVFESGRKVGAEEINPVFNENGSFNEDPFIGIIDIPHSIISIQTEVPSKEQATVTRGSQPTKLVKLDMQQAGVPIDYLPEEKSFEKRYKRWNALNAQGKLESSELYKEIKNNQNLLEALTEQGYRDLLGKVGIKEYLEGGVMKFKVENIEKAQMLLRDEILKRDVNDNVADSLEGFLNGDVVLEATPLYQQVRNILYSIADKNVISTKMTGGQKVQIPSSLLQDFNVDVETVKTKKGEVKTFTSKNLKFYEDEDGKRYCEIMVGRWFDSAMSDKELLEYLNSTEEGQNILKGVAFRIPTQKQNSIDAFVIKQFLPKEFGDSVVIPSALVKKVGSDFDIDKLFMYLKNVFQDKTGKIQLVKMLTEKNSTPEQRYVIWVKENVERDVKKYVRFLTRDAVRNLRTNFELEFARIKAIHRAERLQIVDEFHKEMVEDIRKKSKEQTSEQDKYIEELFNMGHTVFFRMADETRAPFWEMRTRIQKQGVKGPDEIMLYLKVALASLEDSNTLEDDIVRLEALVKIYNEELRVMGLKQETIDEIRKDALAEFRENKNTANYVTKLDLTKKYSSLEDVYEEAKGKLDFDAAVEMADMDGLISFNGFQKLPIERQNGKAALQNAYVDSFYNLVTHPLNFDRLVTPNSADQLKELSREITKKLGFESFDSTSTGNLLNRKYMSRIRHAFVTGKYAIGIAAVNQTNHSLNQATDIYVDPERLNIVSEKDRAFLGDARIKFAKYNKLALGKNKVVATLSFIKDATKNNFISDIIGQFIDGYVDISKGPWIMELGATPNVASTWLFLIKIGVPIEEVAYFMNQPIIKDYLRNIEKSGYSWLFIDDIKNELLETTKYVASSEKVKDITEIPSKTQLWEMVGKKDLNADERAQQQFILNEFLKYAMMANHMFLVTQGSNFDTATFNDPYLIFKKREQLKKARNTIISSVDKIIDNSFLKFLLEKIYNVREGYAQILKSDQPRVRNIVETTLLPYVDLPDNEFVQVARLAVNNLFDWAVQNNKKFNEEIKSILLSKEGVASQISDFVKTVKADPKHPLYENQVINLIVPHFSEKEGGVNNLKIKNKDNKVYDQNQVIYAFHELKNYLNRTSDSKLYDNLVKLAVLQSGLTNSPISFTSMIPYEDFKKIYNETISVLENIPELELFNTLDVFQRKNWNDDDIVPRRAAKWKARMVGMSYNDNMKFHRESKTVMAAIERKEIPPLVKLSPMAREADSDVIVYTWEKFQELLTDEEKKTLSPFDMSSAIKRKKAEMREKGDYSFINKGLFKKVYSSPTEPFVIGKGVYSSYVYKMINPWGESRSFENNYFSANEFYKTGRESVIENGFLKVKDVKDKDGRNMISGEVSDATVMSYFGEQMAAAPTFEQQPKVPAIEQEVFNEEEQKILDSDEFKKYRISAPEWMTLRETLDYFKKCK